MHAQLRSIAEEYRRASSRLDRLVGGLSDAEWAARPDESSWSVAENVAHLNLTSEGMLPELRAAVERAAEAGDPGPRRYRADPVGWLFSKLVGPLPRIGGKRRGRVSTTAPFVPGGDLPRDEVLARFRRDQEEQLELLQRADGRPIHRFKVPSPFVDRVSYNAYATFLILVRHQHRHLQQAEEVAAVVTGRS